MEEQICRDCEKTKSLDEFYLTGRGKPDCVCKECRKEAARKKYEANPYKSWAINTKAYHEAHGTEVYMLLSELEDAARNHDRCMICHQLLHYGKKENGTKQTTSPYLDKVTTTDYVDNNNVLIVCGRCHEAKRDMSLNDFVAYCNSIVLKFWKCK